MGKYLGYLFKKHLLEFIIVSVISFLITLSSLYNTLVIYSYLNNEVSEFSLVLPEALGLIMCFIIPVKEFRFKSSKIALDQLYAFPIKKQKLYFSHYIVGLVETLIPFIISFIFSMLFYLTSMPTLNVNGLIMFFFTVLIFIAMLYTINCFLFLCGNSVGDGIVTMIFHVFSLPLLFLVGTLIFDANTSIALYTSSISPIIVLSILMNNIIRSGVSSISININYIICFVLYILVTGGAIYGIFYRCKKDKAELALTKCESYFSYKVMIPFYVCLLHCLAYILSSLYSFSIAIPILIAGFFGYVIYQRNFKLKWYHYITLLAAVLTGIIVGIIFQRGNAYIIDNDYLYTILNLFKMD